MTNNKRKKYYKTYNTTTKQVCQRIYDTIKETKCVFGVAWPVGVRAPLSGGRAVPAEADL